MHLVYQILSSFSGWNDTYFLKFDALETHINDIQITFEISYIGYLTRVDEHEGADRP